ncbi:MAG: RDD family protein [Steroidobacteraceae bacterium]
MTVTPTPVGLLRRLGAAVSDSLVIFALLALATLIVFVPLLTVLGKRVMAPDEVGWPLYGLYLLSMLGLWFGFYGYFWGRSGQTLGMRAWRIRIEACDGSLLNWRASLRRWTAAWLPWMPALVTLGIADHLDSSGLKALGLGLLLIGVMGLLMIYKSAERLTWHDQISNSRVILLPER